MWLGVSSSRIRPLCHLRKEFLKEKDPTLEKLLKIGNNRQRSADVDKNMETSATVRQTTCSYKKGKNNNWKAKVAECSNPGGTAQRNDKSQKAASKPKEGARENVIARCGRQAQTQGKECPALNLKCIICGKQEQADTLRCT